MIEEKVLVITSLFPKELTHLYGLVDKQEVLISEYKQKIDNFYNSKQNELNNFVLNNEFYSYLKQLKDNYKNQIIFINQEVDNKYREFEIDALNIHGNINDFICLDCNKIHNLNNCPNCNSTNNFYGITFKEDKNQYKQVIDLVDKCKYLIFIGEMGQLDPTLFLDEMVDSLYINLSNIDYVGKNPYVEKKEKLSEYFDNFLIINNFIDSINTIDEFLIKNLKKENKEIDILHPYGNKEKEVIDVINNYFEHLVSKYNIQKRYDDRRTINKLKKIYPFVSKLPETYVGNIWHAFCNDINKKSIDIDYNDMFYDMLLVYSVFRWEGTKKYFTTRPKINLSLAYSNNNNKEIDVFKKLIFKKNYLD